VAFGSIVATRYANLDERADGPIFGTGAKKSDRPLQLTVGASRKKTERKGIHSPKMGLDSHLRQQGENIDAITTWGSDGCRSSSINLARI
jgi:hypothetical protein